MGKKIHNGTLGSKDTTIPQAPGILIFASMKHLILLTVLVVTTQVQAQSFGCIDSSQINPYSPCSGCYRPVCGCDGNTYRNQCFSQNWGVQSYVDGICTNFDIDFVPNPVDPLYGFSQCDYYCYIFVHQNWLPVTAYVYLYDIYYSSPYFFDAVTIQGNDTFGQGKGTPVTKLTNAVFSNLREGVYVLMIEINGERKSKKLVVVNTQY